MCLKRLTACLLLLCILAALLPTGAGAADAVDSGSCGTGLSWTLDSEGTLTVSGTGDMTDYTSGSKTPWHARRDEIRHVVLEPGVTGIGKSSFSNCGNLTDVRVPSGVTRIGANAFDNCSSLKSVNFPAGLTAVGNYAFSYCRSLTALRFAPGLTTIGEGAFFGCSSLSVLSMPESLTTVGDFAFYGCSLTDVCFAGAESGWTGTVQVGIENGPLTGAAIRWRSGFCGGEVLWSLDADGMLTVSGNGGMDDFASAAELPWQSLRPEIRKVSVEIGVTGIGSGAFSGCSALTELRLPESLTEIGTGAFSGCSSLQKVLYYGSEEEWSRIRIGGNNAALAGAARTAGCTRETAYSGSFGEKLSWVLDVSGKLTVSGEGAIPDYYAADPNLPWNLYRSSIRRVSVQKGVTGIGNNAFLNCKELTDVSLTDGVTRIGDYAFCGCGALTGARIPSGVTEIGDHVFSDCVSLTWVSLPSGLKTVGPSAFEKCSSLTDVTLPSGVTAVKRQAFLDCAGLESVTLPEKLEELGNYAFSGCTGLTELRLPSGLTTIGNNAFTDCTGLKKLSVSEGLKDLGKNGFSGCTGLREVNLPASLTKIGEGTFRGCTGLTAMLVPGNVQVIEGYAFNGCTGLTRLSLPAGLTEISISAFYNCGSLRDVCYAGTPADWNNVEVYRYNDDLKAAKLHWRSGLCGENVIWELGEADMLLISGEGAMSEFVSIDAVPWQTIARKVSRVVIGDGVTGITRNAFSGCSGLTDLYFCGAEEAWNSIRVADGNSPVKNAKLHLTGGTATLPSGERDGSIVPEVLVFNDAFMLSLENVSGAGTTGTAFAACYSSSGRFVSCRMVSAELVSGERRWFLLNAADLIGSDTASVQLFTAEGDGFAASCRALKLR